VTGVQTCALPIWQGLAVTGDVAVEADVQRMIADGVRKFGALHVLYNNAGVLWKDRDRSVLETDEKWWDRVMAINLKSVFWVSKHGIPQLQKAGGGSIIMMGSVSALAGFTRAQDAYTAAKGALISLTKSLAIQFARDRIRCNVIHPGIVDTPLQAPYLTDAIRKEFETGIPPGRIAQPRGAARARPVRGLLPHVAAAQDPRQQPPGVRRLPAHHGGRGPRPRLRGDAHDGARQALRLADEPAAADLAALPRLARVHPVVRPQRRDHARARPRLVDLRVPRHRRRAGLHVPAAGLHPARERARQHRREPGG